MKQQIWELKSKMTTPSSTILIVDNAYEYVDLGLPSGTKWAKMNLGATSESDVGLYFHWGGLIGYPTEDACNALNYKYWDGSSLTESGMTKYNKVDGKQILDLEDDAAYSILGNNWRIPSVEQIEELMNNTIAEPVISGIKFISKFNNNFIIFPIINFENMSMGRIWSNSIYATNCMEARELVVYSTMGEYVEIGGALSRDLRVSGAPIRPVC